MSDWFDNIDRDAIFTYVADFTPIELIAEAWLVLADFDLDPTGRTPITSDSIGYLEDEWCKMAKRTIRGFAEAHERPRMCPWTDRRFDIFDWRGRVVDGEVTDRQSAIGGSAP